MQTYFQTTYSTLKKLISIGSFCTLYFATYLTVNSAYAAETTNQKSNKQTSILLDKLVKVNDSNNAKVKTINTLSPENTISTSLTNNDDQQNSVLTPAKDYKYYTTEVILFRHTGASALTSELWEIEEELDDETDQNFINGMINQHGIGNSTSRQIDEPQEFILTKPLNKPSLELELANYIVERNVLKSFDPLVTQVQRDNFSLLKEASHIKHSRYYDLLTHFAWTQPGYNKKETLPIKILFPDFYGDISAKIKVSLARYLHTEIDLKLHEEVCRKIKKPSTSMDSNGGIKVQVLLSSSETLNNKIEDKNAAYNPNKPKNEVLVKEEFHTVCQREVIPFKQSRKMRSKKLHYIDHPAFGLVVLITPTKVNEERLISSMGNSSINKSSGKQASNITTRDKNNNNSKAPEYKLNRALDL